ncbi:MAG: cupin domain-containing protein [Phycisphaerales bacterium]|nr:cupin domain-containing protein [Phycisphaerales bacterium]
MTTARLLTLDQLPTDHPMPLLTRRRIIGEHMMISQVLLAPGFTVAVHSHANEQFVVMLRGRAEFDLVEGSLTRTIEVRGGQTLVLPPNVPHGCRAIEECLILDLFSPVSQTTGVDTARACTSRISPSRPPRPCPPHA